MAVLPRMDVAALGLAIVFTILSTRRIRRSWYKNFRGRPLPPGPPGLPVVGNLFDMSKSRLWEALAEMAAKYGDIMMLRILNQRIVIVGGSTILEDLEKKSSTSSSRVESPSLEMSGTNTAFGFMPYGPTWRLHRRMFWQHFNSNAISKYEQVQREHAHGLARLLLDDPSTTLQDRTRTAMSSVLLKIVYGLEAEEDDESIQAVESGLDGLREQLISGTFLVDVLPFLQYAPSVFPFQQRFARWKHDFARMMDLPFERYMAQNSKPECVVSEMIDGADKFVRSQEEKEQLVRAVSGVVFAAGSETTGYTILVLFVAMALYPEVQRRVHAELDAVVGMDRLPDFSDRPNLTYVNAIVKEMYRWLPVVPVGLGHVTTEDEELGGYFIPKGTVLMTNIWAYLHDPKSYADPEEFQPERWIKGGKMDPSMIGPEKYMFGFGRRICPGRHFADAAVFITVAMLLHVFAFSPPLDENGEECSIIPRLADMLFTYPEDSRCTVKPRSARAEELIRGDLMA